MTYVWIWDNFLMEYEQIDSSKKFIRFIKIMKSVAIKSKHSIDFNQANKSYCLQVLLVILYNRFT